MDPLFNIPEDFTALSEDELRSFIAGAQETAATIGANSAEFVSDERTAKALMEEMTAGVTAIEAAKAELASRNAEAGTTEPEDEPAAVDEGDLDEAALAELAERAAAATVEPEPVEPAVEPEPVAAAVAVPEDEPLEPAVEPEPEPVIAAAPPRRRPSLPRPSRARHADPVEETDRAVPLVAAAENLGFAIGDELPDATAIAEMMVQRQRLIGDNIPEGLHGEKNPIARADYRSAFDESRILSDDVASNLEKIDAVVASAAIQRAFEERRAKDPGALVASGGLCAPVTPYYNLQFLSVANRPVRAALPAFSADRGGIRFARPAGLSAITDAVGTITAAEDKLGGSSATKTCQRIDCPPFEEVDIAAVYHCLEFGTMGARTFPELVAQWNNLVLAAHARHAETNLLDGIDAASTQVDASALGLGASATIPSQIITASVGVRSRNRMDPEAVLRVMLPFWLPALIVSDVYRSQFDRFGMTPERFIAILREANVEPTFYLDGASDAGQVFNVQADGPLNPFPAEVRWYLYPEGSFLYLDGGTLELGLVRDSVLNKTNDFQIFGETFEEVAFIGVESLAVTTPVCDSGAVSIPVEMSDCGNYAVAA